MQSIEKLKLTLIGEKCIVKATPRGEVTFGAIHLPDFGVLSQGEVIHSSIDWIHTGDKIEFDRHSAFGLFDMDPDGAYHVVNEAGILGVYDREGEIQPSPGRSTVVDVHYPEEARKLTVLPDDPLEYSSSVVQALVTKTRIKEIIGRQVLFLRDKGYVCYEKLPKWEEVHIIDDDDILAVLEV